MPVEPPPLIDKFEAPRPVIDRSPDKSLIVSGVDRVIVLPVRLLSKLIRSSPGFAAAVEIASLKEPAPESLVLVTTMGTNGGIYESVPPTVRLPNVPKNLPPVIKVRLVGQVTADEIVIFPAVLLPIVRVRAVILPISPVERPRVVFESFPIPMLISVPLPIG